MKVGDLVTVKHVKGLIGIIMSEIPTTLPVRVYEVFISDPGDGWDIGAFDPAGASWQKFGMSQLVCRNMQI
jgi:hypothetical protein